MRLQVGGDDMSTVKIKLLLAGNRDADDLRPLILDGSEVECVT